MRCGELWSAKCWSASASIVHADATEIGRGGARDAGERSGWRLRSLALPEPQLTDRPAGTTLVPPQS